MVAMYVLLVTVTIIKKEIIANLTDVIAAMVKLHRDLIVIHMEHMYVVPATAVIIKTATDVQQI